MKTKTTTDGRIEKAAERHAAELRVPTSVPGAIAQMFVDIAKSSYRNGAEEALASQWRDVEEELPEDGQFVLTHDKDGYYEFEALTFHKEYDGTKNCFESWGGNPQWPDYWMPIPALPGLTTKKNEQ